MSSVCGSDARFVDVLDGKDVECRGECAGDDREMERWDAVSASESSNALVSVR